MNPERMTGYAGKNIWPIIYNENCFSIKILKTKKMKTI